MSQMVTCLRDAVLITPYCRNTGQRSSVHFLTSIGHDANHNFLPAFFAPGFGAIPSAEVRHISHYSRHRPRKEFFVLLPAMIKTTSKYRHSRRVLTLYIVITMNSSVFRGGSYRTWRRA
jgi:hypothetical protein